MAASAAFLALQASSAIAVPIEYIFRGNGTFTLAGAAFGDTDFRVNLFGDTTSAVLLPGQSINTATSATFTVGAVTVNLTGVSNDVRVNTGNAAFPIIIFGQTQAAAPFFVAEGLANAAFVPYDLTTAFPLTGGSLSFIDQVFQTDFGLLDLQSANSLSFEAVTAPTPLPGALPLFASGLAGLGLFGLRRKRKAQAA